LRPARALKLCGLSGVFERVFAGRVFGLRDEFSTWASARYLSALVAMLILCSAHAGSSRSIPPQFANPCDKIAASAGAGLANARPDGSLERKMRSRADSPSWSGWQVPAPPTTSSAIPPWVRHLVLLMDGAFRIPGTEIRVGLDPILGLLLPGAGDVLGALPSFLIIALATRQGVPPVVVLRMLLNVAIDSLVGAIPLFGDLFDVTFRSNQMNLALLERHAGVPRKPRFADYLVVGVAVAVGVSLVLLPLLLVALLAKLVFTS
jgi:hypothetical protein